MKKILMKDVAMSAKTLKILKHLPKILLNIDLINQRLLSCFFILFKRRLGSITKVFMFEVFLVKLNIPEPIDAW